MSLTGSLALPTWALFYFIGTCLWAFYRAFPSAAVQALSPDAVFPNFIMHQLPPGGFAACACTMELSCAATPTLASCLSNQCTPCAFMFQRCNSMANLTLPLLSTMRGLWLLCGLHSDVACCTRFLVQKAFILSVLQCKLSHAPAACYYHKTSC